MSYFFTVAEDLKQDLGLAQQVADQKNNEAHAVYKQRHDDWVKFRVGSVPPLPGTWMVTTYNEVVNDVEQPIASTIRELVMHKVHRPALVDGFRHSQWFRLLTDESLPGFDTKV